MPETYTKMWESFFGGEFTGGTALGSESTNQQYIEQTKKFYQDIIGPAFLGEGTEFGKTALEGWYASFDPAKFEQAEEIFRSAIGDPYMSGQDPFAWEKVSRYDTAGGDESRIQQLLESELYGQGKFLGGEIGSEYGTETSKALETYTSGLAGEREGLTYESLTAGEAEASGTSGTTIRSGGAKVASEDILIEAYKKAKTLGSEYKAGTGKIGETLEGDLNDALTTYLKTIDEEKEDWFKDVMRNVQTFHRLETGEEGADLRDEEIAAKLGYLSSYQIDDETPGMREWGCGYGQKWDPNANSPEGKGACVDDPDIVTGGEFRGGACGIGEIWNPELNNGAGDCEVRTDLELGKDNYGYLCASDNPGLVHCGECNKNTEKCWDGTTACSGECPEEPDDCAGVAGGTAELDECGICDGDGAVFGDTGCCEIDVDECGICGGDGSSCAKAVCWDGSEVDDISQCPHQSCVETGCLQYGSQYVCNEDTGYCQDPSKFKPDKGRKPYTEDVIVDCPDGMWFDGSDCVPIPKDELEDGDECPSGMIHCGGHCICFPGEICSQGECVSEDVEPWPDPPDPGPEPKRPGGFRPEMK